MTGTCRRLDGLVAVVTGAGRGLGRAHALTLASLGARLVVNDLGGAVDGSGADVGPAAAVVAEITSSGGAGIADTSDVGDWAACEALAARAVSTFGRLDIVVNNAGILRPRTLVGMTDADWDLVLRVNLRSAAAMTHFAAVHWRSRAKAGEGVRGRVINTTSGAGLYGNGQANYAAAKAGVAALTLVAAGELGRYGVTVNAVAPIATTRMGIPAIPEHYTPDHVARLVAWLASPAAEGVTGIVFNVGGGHISVAEPWHTGPAADREGEWSLDELDGVVPELVVAARAQRDLLGYRVDEPRSPLLPNLAYERRDG